jgi:hypothetical protein
VWLDADLQATAASIARVQLVDGSIPWEPGKHVDPWNLVEAAMGLDEAGRPEAAAAAYGWLAAKQRCDGAWAAGYRGYEVVDATLDANFSAYPAVGILHHYLVTGDRSFVESMWPVVDRAIGFVLDLQAPSGEVMWARDAHYEPWPAALITSSSCIHLSLRCAVALAEIAGEERPDWELSAELLRTAVADRSGRFLDKSRYSMDWYYPVLGGVFTGAEARSILLDGWDRFVLEGYGVRCVADHPWITAGETCELVMALAMTGLEQEARRVFGWIHHLRSPVGAYWTGATFPDGTIWPRELATWNAGAVLMAAACLQGSAVKDVLGTGVAEPASDPISDLL